MNRLEVALDLARQKIPVFPYELRGTDKVPAIKRWNTDGASIDPKTITAWFGNGSDYRVGVPTGRLSGFDVLDVDPRNGGDAWEEEHRSLLPATQTHTTLQGGRHRVLKHAEGVVSGKGQLGPGIDVLGDNGFAAWWPAEGYAVSNAGLIAEWPPELLALLRVKSSAAGGSQTPKPLAERLPPSAAAVTTLLHRMPNPRECDRDTYVVVMYAARGCIVALIEAGRLQDGDEVAIRDAAVDWAMRWEAYKGTDELEKWTRDFGIAEVQFAGWKSLQAVAKRLIPEYATELASEEFRSDAKEQSTRKGSNLFKVLTLETLLALPDPVWLIDELLVANTLAVLYGQFRSFKSFIALDWALCLATDTDWQGHPVQQTDTLYIAGEGVAGLKLRIGAWMQHHGITGPIPGFRAIPLAVNLMDRAEATRLIVTIVEEHNKGGFDPGLVIVDTLHRSMLGADENSAKDMGVAINNANLIQRKLDCALLAVHHAGKDADRGLRGSSGLPGAADTIFRVNRIESCASLSVEKQKDAEDGQEVYLRARVIKLPPIDPETLECRATSLVLVADSTKGAKAAELTPRERRAREILVRLATVAASNGSSSGQWGPVSVERWMEECEAQCVSTAKTKKHRHLAIRRIMQGLLNKKVVAEHGGEAWPV
jgi:hypothetical protein